MTALTPYEQWQAMTPRDRDALIAHSVFKGETGRVGTDVDGVPYVALPFYTTRLSDAGIVLEWIKSQRDDVCVGYMARDGHWECEASDDTDYLTGFRADGSPARGCAVLGQGDTPALAICDAARQLAQWEFVTGEKD